MCNRNSQIRTRKRKKCQASCILLPNKNKKFIFVLWKLNKCKLQKKSKKVKKRWKNYGEGCLGFGNRLDKVWVEIIQCNGHSNESNTEEWFLFCGKCRCSTLASGNQSPSCREDETGSVYVRVYVYGRTQKSTYRMFTVRYIIHGQWTRRGREYKM